VTSSNQIVVCNGQGTCSNGSTGNGTCACYPQYRGATCAIDCPGVTENGTTCNGLGTCDIVGLCECNFNRGGSDCSTCSIGFSGANCVTPCFGGVTSPCSGHGVCNDGLIGDGSCKCYSEWEGVACDQKKKSFTGWLATAIALIIVAGIATVLIIVGAYYYRRRNIQYSNLEQKNAKLQKKLKERQQDSSDNDEEDFEEGKTSMKEIVTQEIDYNQMVK